ncbi:MAG: hypothetical protein EXX96DRAFT_653666 [Benjaminiella poitrasii]|nr:MAG: hypothetical protein EXX96DRAFT_653666 [Benjaminiella poitrasii]
MGLFEKIKTNVEMWKIEKYTKRRTISSPDFEQKDREFYRQNYKDGIYLHQTPGNNIVRSTSTNDVIHSIGRRTTLLRTSKSEKIMRSSENYNRSTRK